ncbi:hypothetical protein [Methylobacter sp.]|uniref:hypothetical protein n=1 Tax=Methylobacter sp. TaxID=2051955 RepID=UPI002FDD6F42
MPLKLKFTLIVLSISAIAACTQKSVIRDQKENLKSSETIQELMLSLIAPTSDGIWDSANRSGIVEQQPQTNEEWAAVRQQAVTLLDAAERLSEGGRRVAVKDSKFEIPGIKKSPEEIQQLIDAKPEIYFRYAQQLQATAEETLAAIDAKNATALLEIGGRVDDTCEQCHKTFWYPNQFESKQ